MSKYFVFGAVGLSLLLSNISNTAISVAFPVITSSFESSLILDGWVLSIYQLVATATMPLAGKAGDIFGGKRVFMTALGLYIMGSLLCAIAPNIYFLILSRLIQAVGGGSFLPLAAGIVADEFPESRQKAIGLLSSIFPIGQIIGPNIGGLLVDAFGWRSIFWLNIPIAAIALIASAILLRSSQKQGGRMDLTGAGLFMGSLFAFMTGFSAMGNSSEKSSWLFPGLLFVAAVVLMITFLRHERKAETPFIDQQVLRKKPFIAANTFNFLLGVCMYVVLSFIPLYAVSVYGMSILASGLVLTTMSLSTIVGSSVTSVSLMRWGYRWPMLFGTCAMALSLYLLGVESPGTNILGIHLSSTVLLMGILLLAGIGLGVVAPAANNACIELMPHRVATITGVRGMFRQSGGAISIAVTALLLNNIGDMARGFAMVFSGLAVVMIVAVPSIFLMPKSPKVSLLAEDIGKDG